MVSISAAARVERGVRSINDDRALVLDTVLNESNVCGECETPAVAAVCDGCGGYYGGGTAATIVLETLKSIPAERICDEATLVQALDECRRRVMLKKERERRLSKMCTTIAGVLFDEDKTFVFHSGDSRVYRFDGKYLVKMTNDHSAVQEMINIGLLKESDLESALQKNVITRCIGVECAPPEVHVSYVSILPGETYLICSDGFWGSVIDNDIINVLSSDQPIDKKADELVELALAHNSRDNISVCLCSRDGEKHEETETDKPFVLD